MELLEKLLPLIVFILIAIFSSAAQQKQKQKQRQRERERYRPAPPPPSASREEEKPLFEKIKDRIDTISRELEESMQQELPHRPRPAPQRQADEEEWSMEGESLEGESQEAETTEYTAPEAVNPEVTIILPESAPPISPTHPDLAVESDQITATEIGNATTSSIVGQPSLRRGVTAIALPLTADKAREGIILSEILGKPVAMREELP